MCGYISNSKATSQGGFSYFLYALVICFIIPNGSNGLKSPDCSGNLKAEGYVLADIPNVEKVIRISTDSMKQISKLINSFLNYNFTPINQWMAYYESGVLAFECHIGLVGSNIPFEDGGSSSDGEGEYSIEQAFKYNRTKLFPALIKQFTAFDKNGDIIIEQNFTNR